LNTPCNYNHLQTWGLPKFFKLVAFGLGQFSFGTFNFPWEYPLEIDLVLNFFSFEDFSQRCLDVWKIILYRALVHWIRHVAHTPWFPSPTTPTSKATIVKNSCSLTRLK
jgi:hypothetical protein